MKPRQPPRIVEIRGQVPIPAGEEPGRCEWKSDSGPLLAQGRGLFRCRRTGRSFIEWHPQPSAARSAGTTYPLEARYVCEQCFGPLEVAYDHSGLDAGGGEAQDPGRPAGHLALRRLPAVRRAPARPAGARPDAAGARRPARRAPRPRRGLDQERRRQPDPLVQGPGRRGRASRRRASSASRPSPAPRPATSPTRSPRTPPPPGSTPTSSSPPTSRSRSCSRPASTAPSWSACAATTTTSTGSAPSSPRTRPWAFVNVNLRPYYAEGSKTLAYETVEQLGWELPDRVVCPIASGSLFTKIGRGLRASGSSSGLVEGELPAFNGAQATGCSPVADGVRGGLGRLQAAEAGHDRQEPRDRRPGRRPLRARARAAHRRRDRLGHRRRDPRRHPAAGRDDRDLHRDRRRGDDRGAGEARRARRDRPPRAGRRLHHRRGPEDARRGPRRVRDARDRADARRRSSAELAGASARLPRR